MRVFLLRGDRDYQVLRPEIEDFWVGRSGVASLGHWQVPRLVPFNEEQYKSDALLSVDAWPLDATADGFVLSERARRVLGPVLSQCGELLPVYVLDRILWWFNCLVRVDALAAGTSGEWIESGGERFLAEVRQLEFQLERVQAAPPVFRVPELPAGYLFAGLSLLKFVERSELVGFRFDLVWSVEDGGVVSPEGFGFELNNPDRVEAKRFALRPK